MQESVDAIVKEFNGRLDVFVANSGIPWTQGAMLDGEVDHYQKVMKVDMDGTYYCAYAAGHHFRRQFSEQTDLNGNKIDFRGGSFIATASMSAHIVNIPQLQAAYNAAKAAVIHFCEYTSCRPHNNLSFWSDPTTGRSIAVEWVQFARVNTVSPGYMATEISDFVPQDTQNIWNDKIPMG